MGIDFGGSGIKGAPVDLAEGEFAADRVRIDTPQPSTPDAVAEVAELLEGFPARAGRSIEVTVPGIVQHGVVHSPPTSTMPGSAPTPTVCSRRQPGATSTW
ncbi:MAG: hypothetical protein R2734_09875 [Nocardioides sp.]